MREYCAGMRAGIPIGLGYFSVSFGFGTTAISYGLQIWEAILISASNLTSAGQFAGLTVISAGGLLLEMFLTQLVINSRYALMSLALGQRLPSRTAPRLLAAFFNTDEVFALGMARQEPLTARYFTGAGTVAALGWISGTALGAVAGSVLPASLQSALGTMLYGMFIAIVVPQAKQEPALRICAVLAVVLSCLFYYLPFLNTISPGLAIVICTILAAMFCAIAFPIEEQEAAE